MSKQKTPRKSAAKSAVSKAVKKATSGNITSLAAVKKASVQAAKQAARETAKVQARAQKVAHAVADAVSSPNRYAFAMPAQPVQSFSRFFSQFPFNSQLNTTMESIMTKSPLNFDQFVQQATEQSRQTVEAAVKSANIWANGVEQLMKTSMQFMQDSQTRQTEAFKTLMSCKTINELTEAQNQLAQRAYDDMITSATKMSEISAKVATDSLQPLNEQMSKTMKKASAA